MKISVVTAVFNRRATIADALNSALAQIDANFELVVIDGGSTDGTLDVLHCYGDRLAALVSEPDRGIYHALNKGIQRAGGDVIGFLHSDDLLGGDRVLSRIATAFSDPMVDAVYGDLLYVRKEDPAKLVRYWRAGEFTANGLRAGWMPPHPTFYVRREVYDRLGGFNTSYRIAADYDCMLRFLGRGGVRCRYIPEVLVKMRIGGSSNRNLKNILLKSLEDYRALRDNEVGAVGTLLMKNFQKILQFFLRPSE